MNEKIISKYIILLALSREILDKCVKPAEQMLENSGNSEFFQTILFFF